MQSGPHPSEGSGTRSFLPLQAVGDPWLLAALCPFLLLPHVVSLWPCIAGVFFPYKGSGAMVLRGHSTLA